MGKIAFVFAGQGAQYAGMGESLYGASAAACTLYEKAEALRPGTMEQSFHGTDEELKQTANTQPCLYLVDLSAALALSEAGIRADAVAGFSLGEVAALAFAGVYSPEDGFAIVTKRGAQMQKAAEQFDTGMTAVMRLAPEEIEAIAKTFDHVYPVNYNAPGQTVVSGSKAELEPFKEKITEAGGKCIDLAVSAAFHSPYMEEAGARFYEDIKDYAFAPASIPVYTNQTGLPTTTYTAEQLKEQIYHPVLWSKTVRNMIADGFTDFIEVGAGKTLSGLIKKIDRTVNVYNVQDEESLKATIEAVKNHA